jgi:hypothetical protein
MLSVSSPTEPNGGPWPRGQPMASRDDLAGFIPALFSGGDSRFAADPRTGLNKYFCPAVPAPELVCAASCTASPISVSGFDRAGEAFLDIVGALSPRQRAHRLAMTTERVKTQLTGYFGSGALARVILCPSGTDAMLTAALMIASERPGEAMTAILPAASETGTGVPSAAICRLFDGPDSGKPLANGEVTAIEIPLRAADGSPLGDDEVNHAFAIASARATGRVVIWLTHGTKTGLIAPVSPPEGANVVVDACQARIDPAAIAAYLRLGWPVIVTGSKFLGGPVFSGAVLFPWARLPATGRRTRASAAREAANLGTTLRWTAALATIDAFEPRRADLHEVLSNRAGFILRAIAANPALLPVGGLRPHPGNWAALPTIFTFGVRDPSKPAHLLSVAELRPLHERLARRGVLVGQPVALGPFGGLRIAIGARDLLPASGDGGLARVFAVLEEVTARSPVLAIDRGAA